MRAQVTATRKQLNAIPSPPPLRGMYGVLSKMQPQHLSVEVSDCLLQPHYTSFCATEALLGSGDAL